MVLIFLCLFILSPVLPEYTAQWFNRHTGIMFWSNRHIGIMFWFNRHIGIMFPGLTGT